MQSDHLPEEASPFRETHLLCYEKELKAQSHEQRKREAMNNTSVSVHVPA